MPATSASPPSGSGLAEMLSPLTDAPARAAIFCDIDGTLAPIVRRAEDAVVPDEVSRLLGRLADRYGCVACVSGRSAAEARRLVGVGSIYYAGTHGAELMEARAAKPVAVPAFARWEERVRRFADNVYDKEMRLLRVRGEDKGPIAAFHWRDVPDEERAVEKMREVAAAAERGGFHTHWGRKVLEIRPPVPVHKGQAVGELLRRESVRTALYAGDDTTDLDGYDALEEAVRDGRLERAVKVGVRSAEGPTEIVERADLVVEGTPGVTEVLVALASPR